MKNIKIALATLTLLITSCIEEYKIPFEVVSEFESELVIEGRILSGEESVVFVSRTVPFTGGEVEPDSTAISNAQVTIIGENGYESPKAFLTMKTTDTILTHTIWITTPDMPSKPLLMEKHISQNFRHCLTPQKLMM